MKNDPRTNHDDQRNDPIETAVFLTVLIAGFLLIHFLVVPIW